MINVSEYLLDYNSDYEKLSECIAEVMSNSSQIYLDNKWEKKTKMLIDHIIDKNHNLNSINFMYLTCVLPNSSTFSLLHPYFKNSLGVTLKNKLKTLGFDVYEALTSTTNENEDSLEQFCDIL